MGRLPWTIFVRRPMCGRGVSTTSLSRSRIWKSRHWRRIGRQKERGTTKCFRPRCRRWSGWSSSFGFVCERQTDLQNKLGYVLGCAYCSVGSEVGTNDAGIREKVQENFARMQQYFESAIRDAHAQGLIHAPDAKGKAKLLFAYFQGTMTQARIENNLELLCSLNAGALELLGARQPETAGA